MSREQSQGPFSVVGRIGIGSVEAVGEPHGLRVTVPVRDVRGLVEMLGGSGADLAAAIAAALGRLAATPFAIESLAVTAGRAAADMRLARVLVRSLDPGQPRFAGLPARSRLRHYLNLGRTAPRLRRLLRDFRWDRIAAVHAAEIAAPGALPAWSPADPATRRPGR